MHAWVGGWGSGAGEAARTCGPAQYAHRSVCVCESVCACFPLVHVSIAPLCHLRAEKYWSASWRASITLRGSNIQPIVVCLSHTVRQRQGRRVPQFLVMPVQANRGCGADLLTSLAGAWVAWGAYTWVTAQNSDLADIPRRQPPQRWQIWFRRLAFEAHVPAPLTAFKRRLWCQGHATRHCQAG